MNAPPWPMNPSVGEWFQNWIWNGNRWVCSRSSGIRVMVQVFRASGPYQPSPGLVTAMVECIGGGGGGGVAGSPGAVYTVSGGGGGSGGYSRKAIPAALVVGGVNVTVGAGGAGATGGAMPDGGSGETTSFGAFCTALGGTGGQGNDAGPGSLLGYPGNGAGPGVGDVAFSGESGGAGTVVLYASQVFNTATGGEGGSLFGGGQTTYISTGNYATGLDAWGDGAGAGGSGAVSNQSAAAGTAIAGGAGAAGSCIVTEYCWADSASDGEDCVDPGKTLNVNARVTMAQDDWKPGPRPPGPCGPGRPPVIGSFGGEDWDDGQS